MSGLYGLGRAFNLKYRPNGPLKTFIYDRRMPIMCFGGRQHVSHGTFMQENVIIDNSKRGFWGNLADVLMGLTGAFAIVGNLFGGSKSDVVQGPEEKQVKPQGAKSSDDDAANLKRLEVFAKPKGIQVVSEGNGKFTLLAKDGKNIKDAEYKEAQEWVMNYNATTTPEKTNVEKTNTDPEQKTTVEPDDGSSRVTQDGSERTQRSRRSSRGSGNVDDVEPPVKNEPPVNNKVDKTKAYTKVISAWVSDNTGKGNASVTMPDGSTYYVQTGWSGDKAHAYNDLLRQLNNKLRDAGWTNVTLKLPPDAKIDDKSNVADKKTADADKKAQAADKKAAEEASNEKLYNGKSKKTWDGTLKIKFKLDSYAGGFGSYGLGSVTTPDGKKHVAETGRSLTESRAKVDIREQLLKEIRADGWAKAQIEVVV